MEILLGDSAVWLLLAPKEKNIFILEVEDNVYTETEGENACQEGVVLGFQQYISSLRKCHNVQKKHGPYKTVSRMYVTL